MNDFRPEHRLGAVDETLRAPAVGASAATPLTWETWEERQFYLARGQHLQGEAIARAFGAGARGIRKLAQRLAAGFRARRERAHTYRALARLDDRLLRDIGLQRDGLEAAVARALERSRDRGPCRTSTPETAVDETLTGHAANERRAGGVAA